VSTPAAVYTGRFAPSPTGPLHAGSLVAALASWLDARAWNHGRGGRWLVRIEDLDTARCVPGADRVILQQLHACNLVPDEAPVYQTARTRLYQNALEQLVDQAHAYPCGCSRKAVEDALVRQGAVRQRHGERVYPGTCRTGLQGKTLRVMRLRLPEAAAIVCWADRRLGAQQQDVAAAVGDFVLQGANGLFAYQLAVVVDDHAQGVTHVVRGEDLADNTARQILLHRALRLGLPQYLHTPLVLAADGYKLSKQNGAAAMNTADPLRVLGAAAAVLGLPPACGTVADVLLCWVSAWRGLYNPAL